MKKYFLTILLVFSLASAAFAQTMTKQQALDEIARLEKIAAQTPEMLRQAWEVGRTQRETVIDTPYGKVTIKFNLAEIIRERYTGDELISKLYNRHGEIGGNEIRLNIISWKNSTREGIIDNITHELGHYMMDRRTGKPTPLLTDYRYRTVEDLSEIEADAFAMRHLGKSYFTAQLKRDGDSQTYIDAVIKRMEEIEREDRETIARLRTIANAPEAAPPAQKPGANTAQSYFDSDEARRQQNARDDAMADALLDAMVDTLLNEFERRIWDALMGGGSSSSSGSAGAKMDYWVEGYCDVTDRFGKIERHTIKQAVKATSEGDARQQVESSIRNKYPTANNINITRIYR